ncbi:16S rRNA (cytosine(1402)-N(4))-methyltransferase RsmH [Mycoplasma sp. Ms02]|uniref:16S rRNA (cytosine(1402)-N(4))-methyltransferase RsmH n=1 Tax=Mycoplasma sp. Ms02 TaxID=353851 RepID=UPI001C8A2325|nr:16S rRNA (cytosine(1402)-N(4))-methyltransferase RsmH [Mycoplasma sp. Ms02]QZE12508.1 16S rRNA (cytosine(1402)-N(4))-methyltransferase RsmH [Mycoplasma sp. Ms02]
MNNENQEHYSVMLTEVVESLQVKPDGVYVDLTLGMGGHSSHILKKLSDEGHLYSFDKDEYAINQSQKRLSQIAPNFTLIRSDFKDIKAQLMARGVDQVDGIIADLGVSSPQLDQAARGFSYNKDAELDMRMDQDQLLTAQTIVNNYSEAELVDILIKNADVKLARQVAKAIIKNRPINSTLELVDVVKSAYPASLLRAKNPAKAIFQAIRIEVNNELDSLRQVLRDATSMLKPGGVLSIITFHSIEDKIVKNFFGDLIKDKHHAKLPIIEQKDFIAKQVKPSEKEIAENRRSRSAKLRYLIKLSKNDK